MPRPRIIEDPTGSDWIEELKTNGFEPLVDIDAAAKLLGVSRQWMRDHTTRIKPIVPHIRLGRKIRFRLADLKRFIDQQTETRPRWEKT